MKTVEVELVVAEEKDSRERAQAEVGVPDPAEEDAAAAIEAAIIKQEKTG